MYNLNRNTAMTIIRTVNPTLPSLLINSLLNNTPNNVLGTSAHNYLPAVNVVETEDTFRIEVAAPGLKKEFFKLNVHTNQLTISAQVESQAEQTGEKYTKREFGYRSFQRSFTLPQLVNTEHITASYNDGILYISIPKKEEAKEKPAREIQVG